MSLLAGPVFAIAGVMGAAGVLKLARPDTTAKAMKAAGLSDSVLAVRVVALTEIVLAAAAIAFGTRVTATLLTIYFTLFALFSFVLLKRGGRGVPCGCFGETEKAAPTTPIHVVMNAVAALASTAAIVWPTGGLGANLAEQPLLGIPFLVLTGLFGWLWYLGLTAFPEIVAKTPSRRRETTAAP